MEPLRIGLLLDGTSLKRWEAWCLEGPLSRGEIAVEVAIRNGEQPAGARGWRKQLERLRKLPSRVDQVPWMLVDRLDRRFARRDRHTAAAMDEVGLADVCPRTPVIRTRPRASASGRIHRLAEDDVAVIRSYGLDLLLRFGFNILRGGVLDAARFGVWSFHHADNRVNRGGPPGFWEIAHDLPVTGVTLQQLTSDLDNGKVLARAWHPTDSTSWNRNHQRVAARGHSMLVDAIGYLHRHRQPPPGPPEPAAVYCHPLYRAPGPRAALATAARSYARACGRKIAGQLRRTQWHVRWGEGDPQELSVHRLHRVTPPGDRFWADPFPCRYRGECWLFVEEFFYASQRGRIAALKVERDRVIEHAVALDRPSHLSYPFLFERAGHLYMIPETGSDRTIELWRCTRFPDTWEKMYDIAEDVNATDTTLVEHDGLHYLFTNVARNGQMDHNVELHAYVSDDPVGGTWRPHAANPLVVDCRTARMAGGFFTDQRGRLLRCAQSNCRSYGEEIRLQAVNTLTPHRYGESPVSAITPSWEANLHGTHHLSARDGLVALDACTTIPRWRPGPELRPAALAGRRGLTPAHTAPESPGHRGHGPPEPSLGGGLAVTRQSARRFD